MQPNCMDFQSSITFPVGYRNGYGYIIAHSAKKVNSPHAYTTEVAFMVY